MPTKVLGKMPCCPDCGGHPRDFIILRQPHLMEGETFLLVQCGFCGLKLPPIDITKLQPAEEKVQ